MQVKIGVAGFGVIGSGVIHLLKSNFEAIKDKTGLEIIVHAVADLDFNKDRGVDLSDVKKYNDALALVDDQDIDVVVELIGGVDYPNKLVNAAIAANKHVVTANKALLAKNGKEIYKKAAEKSVSLGIEASVAGGIPIIKTIKESFVGNNIKEIRGIINGTSNYILTKMSENGLSFKDALSKAQELGFAEADPTLDINGGDAAHKIAILASLAFNTEVNLDDVYMEGIDNIDSNDIRFAKELGYVVKLVAIAKDRGEDGIEARVHPMLVPNDNQIAGIRNEFNAVFIKSDYFGDGMLTGKGAGSFPTASAVVGDIVDIALKIRDHSKIVGLFNKMSQRKMIPFGKTENKYYLNFSTIDEPGILSNISGILGENSISIASVIQKEATDKEIVPLVMITHKASEENIVNAVQKINKLNVIKKPTITMRAL